METREVGVSDGKLRLRRLHARPQVEVTTARARIRAGEEVSVFDIGRREFIALLGGAAVAWPLAARAQQAEGMRRIGYLGSGPASAWTTRVEALRAGLRELGWVEGKNIVTSPRASESAAGTPASVAT
jgi:hypothetical protein